MNNHYFYQYDSTKWDWTIKASQKFMQGFKRFDMNIEHKDQVYVGVYGPTQVGKTTFILTLLGISPNYINEISDKLRGGREKGKSATVTCTVFEKSLDNQFHFIWPTGEKFQCQLDEVEKIMGDLRQAIYKNKSFSIEPLTIKIPSYYFNQEEIDARIRDLAIIDLPGDDSKDVLEMRHVDKVLKEYISRCKVCIIMEISSQLTSLTKLDKEIVKDWQELPEQFRIVLTRSISNDSIFLDIQKGKINSANDLLATYEYELGRVCEVNDLKTRVYPLEFGDSWSELQEKFPNIFSSAAVWVNEIFSSLVNDLTNIYSPEQEIKRLKSMERFIEKNYLEESKRLKSRIKLVQDELEQITKEVHLSDKHINHEKDNIVKLKEYIKKWTSLTFELDYWIIQEDEKTNGKKILKNPFPGWSALSFSEKKSSILRSRFYGELDDIKNSVVDRAKKINDIVRECLQFTPKELKPFNVEDSWFDYYLSMGYTLDRYFLESTYSKDRERAFDLIKECLEQIEKAFKKYKKDILNQLNKILIHQEQIVELKIEEFETFKKSQVDKQLELEKLEKEFAQAEEEWAFDKQRATQLDLFLMESYVEKAEFFKGKLLDKKIDPVEKWYAHFYWNVMKEQAEGLITNG